MTRPLPCTEHDLVLAGIKAEPYGWPPASPDPGSGRGPHGTGRDQVRLPRSTNSGLYGFRGLPVSTVSGDCRLTVEETIVEVSRKNSPTGQRMLTKPYPKDNEPRTLGLPPDLLTQLADWINQRRLGPDDLLFATRDGTPISRNTFRTRVWLPAVKASGVDFDVRVHDLRHAHASWLLSGGSDITSVMDRMGHAQITTTQKYLHPMPDADEKNLTALDRIRNPERPGAGPGPGGAGAGSDQAPTS